VRQVGHLPESTLKSLSIYAYVDQLFSSHHTFRLKPCM